MALKLRAAIVVLLAGAVIVPAVPAQNASDSGLDKVREELKEQSVRVGADEAKVAKLLEEIRALDARLLDAARAQQGLIVDENALERDYRSRLENIERAEKERAVARGALETRLADIYKRGRLGSTRALVQAAASTEPLRIARYLAAISQADASELNRYEKLRREYAASLRELDDKKEEIDRTKAELKTEKANYERARGQKTALLGEMEKALALHRATRAQLATAEGELQKIMVSPGGVKGHDDDRLDGLYAPSSRPFGELMGTLDVPVSGRVDTRFGEREQRGSRIQGLLVEATGDRQVVAVSEGEVVFSGPFPGLGKTLIISHGTRYHTVYSHLDSLAHEVGEKVRRNEIIGTLAKADPVLHFELRNEGKAVDPLPWFGGGERAFAK